MSIEKQSDEAISLSEKIKMHFKKHKLFYVSCGIGLASAGITVVIMRRGNIARGAITNTATPSEPIWDAIGVPAQGAIGVLGERVDMRNVVNNVSYISSNRKGPPSWVIRCIETDNIFTSQKKAARGMNLSPSHISEHLNGVRDHVSGYHFERICLAG